MNSELNRRRFLQTSAGFAAAGLAAGGALPAFGRIGVHNGAGRIKVGLIGCGGRGTGAANDMLTASPDVVIVAMGDLFSDRLQSSRENLSKESDGRGERVQVPDANCFTGFEAYKKVLATDVDAVILATPPGFRPIHFKAAVDAGKHVFFEKPVAVDPWGVRTVIEAAQRAQQNKQTVVTGTQRRHERCYLEALKRVNDGAIGKVLSANVYWNQGGLWMHKRDEYTTDMEWQLRNWLYFTWLSGDHIVEQHVHNLDVMNWVMGATPVKCMGMGGRQVRTGSDFGHIFDHFAIEYEYPDGRIGCSQCRQIDGCASRVEEKFRGEKGQLFSTSGQTRIKADKSWAYTGENPNPYVLEHVDFIASVTGKGAYLNEGVRVAESTLTAIMGRLSAYTGKEVTWEQALNSQLKLMPETLEMGPIATPEVAVPGKTPLV
jgi:predicted dehydrogenase